MYLQSPHDIGLYFAGFVSDTQLGITLSTQLKLRPVYYASVKLTAALNEMEPSPKKNGIETRSNADSFVTRWTVDLYVSLDRRII